MYDDIYRDTYQQINPVHCVFEKTINARQATCSYSHRFCLADREGVSCQDASAQQRCQQFLAELRPKAIWALGLSRLQGPLPHAKEIRIQSGSLAGLQQLLSELDPTTALDAFQLIDTALQQYGAIPQFPFETLIQSIAHYQGRKRPKRNSS